MNVDVTIDEAANSFTGVRDNVYVDAGELFLDTTTKLDATAGNFDAAYGFFDGGSGAVSPLGYYYFLNDLDLGAVYTSRISYVFDVWRLDYIDLFESEAGLFDAHIGLFDGSPDSYDDTSAVLEISTSQDMVSWSAWHEIFIGDSTITTSGATIGRPITAAGSFQLWLNSGDQIWGISAAASAAGAVVITYSA